MLDVQVQGEELEFEERRMLRGAERQAEQRRRWREGRDEEDGGLHVQFCMSAVQYGPTLASIDNLSWEKRDLELIGTGTYTTDNPSAPSTITDQVSRTCRHFTRDKMTGFT